MASERWNILRRFIRQQSTADDDVNAPTTAAVSVRRHDGFRLLKRTQHERTIEFHIHNNNTIVYPWRSKNEVVSLNDMKMALECGVDNTGNVCIWPSEEVLAYYCTQHPALFHGKRVIELGAGMGGLASVFVDALCVPACVCATDGNPVAVEQLRRNLESTGVRVEFLQWSEDRVRSNDDVYDVIIVADCLFFETYHRALHHTMDTLLGTNVCGEVIIIAPERSGSLRRFVQMVRERGIFTVQLYENEYDERVWAQHQQFVRDDPMYDANLHYPLLLRLTKRVE